MPHERARLQHALKNARTHLFCSGNTATSTAGNSQPNALLCCCFQDQAIADKERVKSEIAAMDPAVKEAIEKAAAAARAAKKQKKAGKEDKADKVSGHSCTCAVEERRGILSKQQMA
jgi:hypothetical protein